MAKSFLGSHAKLSLVVSVLARILQTFEVVLTLCACCVADGSNHGQGVGRDGRSQPVPGGRGGGPGQPRAQERLPSPAAGAAFWGDYDPVAAASQAAGGGRAQVGERQGRRGLKQDAASAATTVDGSHGVPRSGRERDGSGGQRVGQQSISNGASPQPTQAGTAAETGLQSGATLRERQSGRQRGNRRSRSRSVAADAGEHGPTIGMFLSHHSASTRFLQCQGYRCHLI